MTDINIVIEGDHLGKKVETVMGNTVFIKTSTFGQETINNKNVQDFNILKEIKHNNSRIYTISIVFKSGQKSVLNVDSTIYKKLLTFWPEKNSDRLNKLLKDGYSIIGFSSCLMAAGAMAHNILLQKSTEIEKITFVTNKDELIEGYSHIFS